MSGNTRGKGGTLGSTERIKQDLEQCTEYARGWSTLHRIPRSLTKAKLRLFAHLLTPSRTALTPRCIAVSSCDPRVPISPVPCAPSMAAIQLRDKQRRPQLCTAAAAAASSSSLLCVWCVIAVSCCVHRARRDGGRGRADDEESSRDTRRAQRRRMLTAHCCDHRCIACPLVAFRSLCH